LPIGWPTALQGTLFIGADVCQLAMTFSQQVRSDGCACLLIVKPHDHIDGLQRDVPGFNNWNACTFQVGTDPVAVRYAR
jgi:hypothetical protein